MGRCNCPSAIAGLAALAYLRHHEPAIRKQIASTAVRFTEDRLHKRPAHFEVRILPKDERFRGRVEIQYVRAGHQIFLPRLMKIWREAPSGRVKIGNISGSSKRYGEAQYAGTARRNLRITHRAAAVCALLDEMDLEQVDEDRRVTQELAARWVREARTPAKVSRCILARLFGVSVRRIEQMLAHAPRQSAQAQQVLNNIDAWNAAEKVTVAP